MARFCSKCGTGIPAGDGFCPNCGNMVSMDTGSSPQSSSAPDTNAQKESSAKGIVNSKGIISLILASVALLLMSYMAEGNDYSDSMALMAYGLWIAGIIFGIMGIRQKGVKKGTAIAGIVIASITLLMLVFISGNTSGYLEGYDSGYDSGYGHGYDTGYEVPWHEKMFE